MTQLISNGAEFLSFPCHDQHCQRLSSTFYLAQACLWLPGSKWHFQHLPEHDFAACWAVFQVAPQKKV
jgi:hypothetical protein